jgi:hypothetical protein
LLLRALPWVTVRSLRPANASIIRIRKWGRWLGPTWGWDGRGARDRLLEHGMALGAACGCGGTDAGWDVRGFRSWDAVRDNARELWPNVLFVQTTGGWPFRS